VRKPVVLNNSLLGSNINTFAEIFANFYQILPSDVNIFSGIATKPRIKSVRSGISRLREKTAVHGLEFLKRIFECFTTEKGSFKGVRIKYPEFFE
jgi:hypothetical protein